MSDIGGTNLFQLSAANMQSGSPSWSPDGTKIAFDAIPQGSWEVYVADLEERIPRKLQTGLSSSIRPHWSRDGKWIYFRSYDAGKEGIYRCPASGGEAVRLTREAETFSPIEALDSRGVYFASHQWASTLKRTNLPLDGNPSVVDGIPLIRDASSWALGPGGIYFIPADRPDTLFRFDTSTRTTKQVLKLDKDFGLGLSVSPDGKWLLFSETGDLISDIMFVEDLK